MATTELRSPANTQALDFFAVLGLPRHPWVEPAILKENYHAAASETHPDHTGGNQARFILLGQAVACLKETHARLRHLVELEFPGETKTAPRPDAALFAPVARALDEAKKKRAGLRQATTLLARTTALADLKSTLVPLEKQLEEVGSRRLELEDLCRLAGADWKSRGAAFWSAGASRARFYAKWSRELEDAIFACRNLTTGIH
jgi:hypothetical protein